MRAEIALERQVTGFLEREFERTPSLATLLGLDAYADRLGEVSARALAEHAAKDRALLRELERLDDAILGEDARIDRALLIWLLRQRRPSPETPRWTWDPEWYLTMVLDGISASVACITDPEALVPSLRQRMRQVADVLAAARRQLEPSRCSQDGVAAARAMAAGLSRWLTVGIGPVIDPLGLRPVVQTAVAHVERFAAFLGDLDGRARLDAVPRRSPAALLALVEECSIWCSLDEFGAAVERELGETAEALERLARDEFGGAAVAEVRRNLQQDHAGGGGDLLGDYRAAVGAARDFLLATELAPLVPGEPCDVVGVPASRAVASLLPSYLSPRVDRRGPGSLRVVVPDAAVDAGVAQAVLVANARAWVPVIAVHEAIPGHHAHFARVAKQRLIRRVVVSHAMAEGWATFAERLMYERGFFDRPAVWFAFWDLRRLRALRASFVLDLHWRNRAERDVLVGLTAGSGLPPEIVAEEVRWYRNAPGIAAAHFAGCAAIARAVADRGAEAATFARALLEPGCLPIGLAVSVARRSVDLDVARVSQAHHRR